MKLVISDAVRKKLQDKHGVTEQNIIECFANRCRTSLIDDREDHASDPATEWFIAETFYQRLLMVAYVRRGDFFHIRTCYQPSESRIHIYETVSVPLYADFDDQP